MNYIDHNVTFKDILNSALITGGYKISKGKYKKDTNNNIINNMPIINAIDIDWNKAEIPGIDESITSTGQLLALIGNIKKNLDTLIDKITEYDIIYNLTNVNINNTPNKIKKSDTIELLLSAITGYELPNSVNVLNAEFNYNLSNGKLIIYNATNNVIITINNTNKTICTFNIPSINNLECTIVNGLNQFTINDNINIILSVDTNNYILPTSISTSGCQLISYNNQTGEATLKCTGERNMTINAQPNIKCIFNVPSIDNLSCTLLSNNNSFKIGDTFNISISVNENYLLPETIETINCQLISYNNQTGQATLRCTGERNMTINAEPTNKVTYYFGAATENNEIFILSNDDEVVDVDMNKISQLQILMSNESKCPIDYVNGFNYDNSTISDYDGYATWIFVPSKYLDESIYKIINGEIVELEDGETIDYNNEEITYAKYRFLDDDGNKYKMYRGTSWLNNTVDGDVIKPALHKSYNGIDYIIICINENNCIGKQEFKKI